MEGKKKYSKKWQRWIKRKGISTVAKRLGVTYEAVRLWVNGETRPNDNHKRALVRISRGDLGLGDFF